MTGISDYYPDEKSHYPDRSESIGKLAEALSKAQGEMEGANKSSENPFFKSKYADLYSVWQACRTPLSKNGLAVIQTTKNTNGNVVIITTLIHLSGEWMRGELEVKPGKPDPQALGSAITYGRRYGLAAMVGVSPEDDDGEEAMDRGKDKSAGCSQKDYEKEASAINTPKELDTWWKKNEKEIRVALSKDEVAALVKYCGEKKKGMKKESDITIYHNEMKALKEEFGEEIYRATLKEYSMGNAASAQTKEDRERIINAFKALRAVNVGKAKNERGVIEEECVECPNTGDPDDPSTRDSVKVSYCNNTCKKREDCPAFE